MKNLKLFLTRLSFILLLFFLFIFFSAYTYSKTMFNEISNSFIRFHIIANSDSTIDQIQKYQIRDSIVKYMQPFLINAKSKNDALLILSNHLNEIEAISNNILASNNLPYTSKVTLTRNHFPQKEYSNIILPEGIYDSLQINLGNSQGQNWWCVMYPSFCLQNFSVLTNSNELTNTSPLYTEKNNLITIDTKNKPIHFKFKILELFENF